MNDVRLIILLENLPTIVCKYLSPDSERCTRQKEGISQRTEAFTYCNGNILNCELKNKIDEIVDLDKSYYPNLK